TPSRLGLRQSHDDAAFVDRYPVVARQRELEAAAERRAVDPGHDRAAERLDPAEKVFGGPAQPAAAAAAPPELHSFRSTPARNVFFADVMITPVIPSRSAARRSTVDASDAEKV